MAETAAQAFASLLYLVFEGNHIRTVFQDGQPLACAKDVASAIGLSKYRDAIANHLDSDETRLVSISTGQQMREVTFLTETGIAALVMCSRKPAARRFRRWMLGEVLPQLIQYGSYLPGASAAERLQALHRRWRQERATCLENSAATMEAQGLMTLKAVREEHAVPARDVLAIARRLTHPKTLTLGKSDLPNPAQKILTWGKSDLPHPPKNQPTNHENHH